ncbi:MAG: carbohydrate-binding family 9-like protein [Chitinophagaceae bacterium]
MKEIKVKCISDNIEDNCLEDASNLLDSFNKNKIQYEPWPGLQWKPKVSFAIAHNSSNIFLKYFVEEKHIRAINHSTNSPVYEDSCVEFFISFDEGATYYNIEINCIGTALVGYGSSKNDRQLLETALVDNLKRKSITTSNNGEGFIWHLTLVIPSSIFIHSPIQKLKGLRCKANFYKCGDLLPEPHFMTWSNIIADIPNFHLPIFFGRLIFE